MSRRYWMGVDLAASEDEQDETIVVVREVRAITTETQTDITILFDEFISRSNVIEGHAVRVETDPSRLLDAGEPEP